MTDSSQLFAEQEKKALKAASLEELFDLWKQAHEAEEESSLSKTFPRCPCCGNFPNDRQKFKVVFYPDGYIEDDSRFNGILIICKESNVTADILSNHFKENFWIKERKEKTGKYWNFIKKAFEKLSVENGDLKAEQFCAYMNLNKRGGYSRATYKQLAQYILKYRRFIKRQLEIINPKYIVCGGNGVYNCIKDILPNRVEIILDCWHPSRGFHIKSAYDINGNVIDIPK